MVRSEGVGVVRMRVWDGERSDGVDGKRSEDVGW